MPASSFLISAMARPGLRPLGQVLVQFMMVWHLQWSRIKSWYHFAIFVKTLKLWCIHSSAVPILVKSTDVSRLLTQSGIWHLANTTDYEVDKEVA